MLVSRSSRPHSRANCFEFDGPRLAAAVQATFTRRGTDLPVEVPVALRPEFATLRDKLAQWRAFVERSRLLEPEVSLAAVVDRLREFLWPIVRRLQTDAVQPRSWPPGGPWS